MIQIKDYAKEKRVSYEAVRQQINRYREELGDHIIKKGKTQYLDDTAVAFLDERRQSNPVIVYEHDKDVQIDELKQQNENLKSIVADLQAQIIEKDNLVIKTQGVLLETNQQMLALEQKSDEERKQMEEVVESNRQMIELVQQKDEERQRITEQHEAEKKQAEEEKQLLVQQLDEERKKREELENRGFWARLFNKK